MSRGLDEIGRGSARAPEAPQEEADHPELIHALNNLHCAARKAGLKFPLRIYESELPIDDANYESHSNSNSALSASPYIPPAHQRHQRHPDPHHHQHHSLPASNLDLCEYQMDLLSRRKARANRGEYEEDEEGDEGNSNLAPFSSGFTDSELTELGDAGTGRRQRRELKEYERDATFPPPPPSPQLSWGEERKSRTFIVIGSREGKRGESPERSRSPRRPSSGDTEQFPEQFPDEEEPEPPAAPAAEKRKLSSSSKSKYDDDFWKRIEEGD